MKTVLLKKPISLHTTSGVMVILIGEVRNGDIPRHNNRGNYQLLFNQMQYICLISNISWSDLFNCNYLYCIIMTFACSLWWVSVATNTNTYASDKIWDIPNVSESPRSWQVFDHPLPPVCRGRRVAGGELYHVAGLPGGGGDWGAVIL